MTKYVYNKKYLITAIIFCYGDKWPQSTNLLLPASIGDKMSIKGRCYLESSCLLNNYTFWQAWVADFYEYYICYIKNKTQAFLQERFLIDINIYGDDDDDDRKGPGSKFLPPSRKWEEMWRREAAEESIWDHVYYISLLALPIVPISTASVQSLHLTSVCDTAFKNQSNKCDKIFLSFTVISESANNYSQHLKTVFPNSFNLSA